VLIVYIENCSQWFLFRNELRCANTAPEAWSRYFIICTAYAPLTGTLMKLSAIWCMLRLPFLLRDWLECELFRISRLFDMELYFYMRFDWCVADKIQDTAIVFAYQWIHWYTIVCLLLILVVTFLLFLQRNITYLKYKTVVSEAINIICCITSSYLIYT
jgi:hypothetical protein